MYFQHTIGFGIKKNNNYAKINADQQLYYLTKTFKKKNDINFGLSSLTEGKENVNQRHL